MAKFKNKSTGVILETKDNFVIEQLKKATDYEEIVKEEKTTKKEKVA